MGKILSYNENEIFVCAVIGQREDNFQRACFIEQRRIPDFITSAFGETLVVSDTARRWLVIIGRFSIIRLECTKEKAVC